MLKRTLVLLAVTFSLVAPAAPIDRVGETTASGYWNALPSTSVSVGAGLALLNGSTGWAINAGALKRVSSTDPLFVGLDLGLNFWNYASAVNVASSGATGVALLPTIIYGIGVRDLTAFYPYIGISVGPNIFIENTTVFGIRTSNSRVLLEALLRPGANIRLSPTVALAVEPKLGILSSDFIFLPSANLMVAL